MSSTLPSRTTAFLAKLSSYQSMVGRDAEYFGSAAIIPGETLIGLYRNKVAANVRDILITNMGLHVQFEDHMRFVAYTDIVSIHWSTWNKQELKEPLNRFLILQLHSEELIEVAIAGELQGSLDVYHFHNFLLGAVQSRQIEKRRTINKPL